MDIQGKSFVEFLKENFHPNQDYMHEKTGISVHVDSVMIQIPENFSLIKHNAETLHQPLLIPLEHVLQDTFPIRTARVSTGSDMKAINEKALGLLRSLYEERHESPFESIVLKLKIRTPIQYADYFFQLFGSFNELSGRYSKFNLDEKPFHVPFEARKSDKVMGIISKSHADARKLYEQFLNEGMAREQARYVLPYSFITEFYFTVHLRTILEFLSFERHELVVSEFYDMRDVLFAQLVEDWMPGIFIVFKNTKRIISTSYASSSFAYANGKYPSSLNFEENIKEFIKEEYKNQKINVWDIGEIFFLGFSEKEEILRFAICTASVDPAQCFGHVNGTFFLKIPISAVRQWMRHRKGVWSLFPIDFDYIEYYGDFYIPRHFRKQIGKPMHYVYEDFGFEENKKFKEQFSNHIKMMSLQYRLLRSYEFSSYASSSVLPYTFRVERLWTVPLSSLMNFFSLRMDAHAQEEIRMCANAIYPLFVKEFPWVNEVFLENLNFGESPLFKS